MQANAANNVAPFFLHHPQRDDQGGAAVFCLPRGRVQDDAFVGQSDGFRPIFSLLI